MKLRDLFADGVIKASYANFGYIPYGHGMIGRIYFDKNIDTLCSPVPQQDFTFTKTAEEEVFMTPFMLADRGGCSFVTKVRNMEDAGAAVGIVVDSSDEDVKDVVMSDDGTGAGIRMPSMLISKKDGKKLIDFLNTASEDDLNELALLAMFEIGRPDNRVEYDIWYSSANQRMLDFIVDFKKLDQVFDDSVLMTPHFKIWECKDCDR